MSYCARVFRAQVKQKKMESKICVACDLWILRVSFLPPHQLEVNQLTSNTLILYRVSVRYNRNFLQNCAVNEHDSMCEVFAMPAVSSVPIFWNGINFGR